MDDRIGTALQVTDEGLAKRKREHYRPGVMKKEWEDVKVQLANLAPDAVDERHVHLIADIRNMITHIGDTSNLILDPDLDSYYLMDVTLLALPQTQDRLQETIGYMEGILRRKALTADEKIQLNLYAALLKQSDLDRTNADVQTVLNEDPNFLGTSVTLQRNMPPNVQEFTGKMEEFINIVKQMAGSDVRIPPVRVRRLS